MNLWDQHLDRLTHFLEGSRGGPWSVKSATGKSNEGRFIPGGMLLGVFNLEGFSSPPEGGVILVGFVSAPHGVDVYPALQIGKENCSSLESALNELWSPQTRTNNIRVYVLEHGDVFLEREGFRTSADTIDGPKIDIDGGLVAFFSSTPAFERDRRDVFSVAERFGSLVDSPSFRILDVDRAHDVGNLDYALDPEQQVPVNARILTSLAVKPFLILTGPSGTGKTRSLRELIHYLTPSSAPRNFFDAFVPVEAGWTDGRHLTGYYNPFGDEGRGSYRLTSVLKVLLRATLPGFEELPFFVILDEMNLSHVERYFASFLSIMETARHGFDRGEPLLTTRDLKAAYSGVDDPLLKLAMDKAVASDGLFIPPNVFFAGTVNVDETTYMFSPKVLDRAFVVEFEAHPPSKMRLRMKAEDTRPRLTAATVARFLLDSYAGDEGAAEVDVEDELDELFTIVNGMGFPFADRPYQEIQGLLKSRARLAQIVDDDEMRRELNDKGETLSEILLTKVMTKIHGGRREIEGGMTELRKFVTENGADRALSKIKRMSNELERGYCSFIT